MHPVRKKKLWLVLGVVFGCGAVVALILAALQENINLFYSPSQIAQGEAPLGQTIRGGGLVKADSVERGDGLSVSFVVTDKTHDFSVSYQGILPDLFAENQGIVVLGELTSKTHMQAREVLAKHDENYMPPEAAKALEDAAAAAHSQTK